VQLFRIAGNELMVGATLIQSAQWLWFWLGDPETIHQRLDEGYARIKRVGSRHWLAEYSYMAAAVAWSEGDTDRADSLIQQCLAILKEMDARWLLAWALHIVGRIEVQRGDLSAARRSYQESLALTEALGDSLFAPFDLDGLAAIAVAQGNLVWATQLWGAAEALCEAIAVPLPPVIRVTREQAVSNARAQLGALAFAAAWQQGRSMTPGRALAAEGRIITPPSKPAPTFPAGLTAREVEVVRLVAQGLTNAEIANQLTISVHTVNAHVRSIFNKLDVTSRNALTRFVIEHNLT
jgi:ATP/maltotriose-dependent transcriptional regulator MalT